MRRRLLRAAALGYVICELLVAPAFAQFGSVDQEHLAIGSPGGNTANVSETGSAQTFTVGRSGILSAVEVGVIRQTGTVHTILADIRRVVDGIPDFSVAGVLATQTLSSASLPTNDDPSAFQPRFTLLIDFRSDALRVDAGDRLAIHLHIDPASIDLGEYYPPSWLLNSPGGYYAENRYAGGDAFAPATPSLWFPPLPPGIYPFYNDAHFRAYVLVPEPASMALLLVGAVGLVRLSRPRRSAGMLPAGKIVG